MDMVQATGAEGLPTNTTSTSGAASVGNARIDHEYGSAFHALLMVGTLVILFPLGVMWLRIFNKVILHWLNQTFAVLMVIVGAGIGIYISLLYNKVRLSKVPISRTLDVLSARCTVASHAGLFLFNFCHFSSIATTLHGLLSLTISFHP